MSAADDARRYRDKARGGPARTPEPCGTRAAATRHRRNGEPLDAECVAAERTYNAEAARKRRAKTREPNTPDDYCLLCGAPTEYLSTICDECG